MGKQIDCREVGLDCDGPIHAATEDEARDELSLVAARG